jgi:hypothetical protein
MEGPSLNQLSSRILLWAQAPKRKRTEGQTVKVLRWNVIRTLLTEAQTSFRWVSSPMLKLWLQMMLNPTGEIPEAIQNTLIEVQMFSWEQTDKNNRIKKWVEQVKFKFMNKMDRIISNKIKRMKDLIKEKSNQASVEQRTFWARQK